MSYTLTCDDCGSVLGSASIQHSGYQCSACHDKERLEWALLHNSNYEPNALNDNEIIEVFATAYLKNPKLLDARFNERLEDLKRRFDPSMKRKPK